MQEKKNFVTSMNSSYLLTQRGMRLHSFANCYIDVRRGTATSMNLRHAILKR